MLTIAYLADVAPDPLVEILKDSPWFVDAGMHLWILAEFVTPEVQAEIDRRKKSEANRVGSAANAPEARSEGVSSSATSPRPSPSPRNRGRRGVRLEAPSPGWRVLN